MHSVRSRANRLAWRVEDGSINYNPFARTTSRKSGEVSSPEPGARTTGSMSAQPSPFHATVPETNGGAEAASEHSPTDKPSIEQGHANDEPHDESKESSDETMVNSNATIGTPTKQRGKFNPMKAIDFMLEKNRENPIPVGQQLRNLFFNSWINIMLILVPVGFAINYAKVDPIANFVVNFLAIVPLAGMLSYATENLALFCGENLGGLLNATFGNAVELIVSIFALIDNKVVIVQTSLIGSMFSNLLLVLGMAFFLGGWNRVEQNFNDAIAQTSPSLLAVAVGSMIIPTAYHEFTGEGSVSGTLTKADRQHNADKLDPGVNQLSRGTAILLLVVYAGYLTFQLSTHKEYFNEKSEAGRMRKPSKIPGQGASAPAGAPTQVVATMSGAAVVAGVNPGMDAAMVSPDGEEEEEEKPELSLIGSLVALTGSTVVVAFCSEFMVSGIDSVTKNGGLSEVFVGLILIPIVGNAAEHATAVTVAIKDKITLSIGVAVGSSLQIALFVVPVMVCLGWWIGVEDMNMWFDGFQTTALFISVLLVNYLIADGKSNWLEGLLLMVLYIIIAVAAFVSPNPEGEGAE